jgi:hypothetical protein
MRRRNKDIFRKYLSNFLQGKLLQGLKTEIGEYEHNTI